jgi:hypothetical protein
MYRIRAEQNYTPFALSVASAKSKGERHERTNLRHEPSLLLRTQDSLLGTKSQSLLLSKESHDH